MVTGDSYFAEIKFPAAGTIFIWLRIKYSDPFSDAHESWECWVYMTGAKQLPTCPTGQVHI